MSSLRHQVAQKTGEKKSTHAAAADPPPPCRPASRATGQGLARRRCGLYFRWSSDTICSRARRAHVLASPRRCDPSTQDSRSARATGSRPNSTHWCSVRQHCLSDLSQQRPRVCIPAVLARRRMLCLSDAATQVPHLSNGHSKGAENLPVVKMHVHFFLQPNFITP